MQTHIKSILSKEYYCTRTQTFTNNFIITYKYSEFSSFIIQIDISYKHSSNGTIITFYDLLNDFYLIYLFSHPLFIHVCYERFSKNKLRNNGFIVSPTNNISCIIILYGLSFILPLSNNIEITIFYFFHY